MTERDKIEKLLLEGIAALDRGEGSEMTEADWQDLRDNVRKRDEGIQLTPEDSKRKHGKFRRRLKHRS